ncbi:MULTISPECIES: ABC transporter ATP-binding protein [Actinosynnema]|uniref:ABC transporter ATP-binding protein n=1 Tax=Actinosynnema TaxID=40566 RepID=UPI0020A35D08|nr:ATP-binding cassette domain-containing protein [Actinosynnema pretiosum]MCP2099636.1 ABC-2 type transport system ATP-binding protein [Actinosynnema pretiosum]
MTTAVKSAVRASGLGKSYGGTRALRDCSFELPAGRVAALVGANGAGKTTLLSVLARLLKADAGEVEVTGRVAFVAQEKPLYKGFTARDTLTMGTRLNTAWDQAKADAWLDRFEVPRDRACGKLSGGQQAQVAFALALGSCPDVLLLDEPLANLDPLARREVAAALLDEVAETGMTVVLSTHVITELTGVADHLLLLANGGLLADGDVDALLARHAAYAGPRSDAPPVPGQVVQARHSANQSTFLVRLPDGPRPPVAGPWVERAVTLEDYVLARLAETRKGGAA